MDEETYRQIVRAKGKLEMDSGEDITLGRAVGLFALGVLAGVTTALVLEELKKGEK